MYIPIAPKEKTCLPKFRISKCSPSTNGAFETKPSMVPTIDSAIDDFSALVPPQLKVRPSPTCQRPTNSSAEFTSAAKTVKKKKQSIYLCATCANVIANR